MKSIAIYNNKGGCGKSTSIINIADELSLSGKVLVIDTDGQSNTSRFFGNAPREGLESFLLGKSKIPEAATTRYDNISIISATAAINNAIGDFEQFSDKERGKIADKLVNSHKDYDYVIVDLPPAMNAITERIIGACGYVFVPIELGTFSVQGITKVTSAIAEYKAKFGGVFVNKFDKKNSADLELMELLKKELGDKAMRTTIPYSKVIKNSITYGNTSREYMGWTAAGKAFGELTKEILERIGD